MKQTIILLSIAFQLTTCDSTHKAGNHMVTNDFEFVSGSHKLSVVIDQPTYGETRAVILFIDGSGPTDIRANNMYIDLRSRFAKLGIACVSWDKPGCGQSKGSYNPNRTAKERSEEVLDAINYLKNNRVAGLNHIIIWSSSGGSLVAPLVLSERSDINHRISVSGLADIDNKYYLLKSNLPLDVHVLALFGEKNTNIDWRQTKALYESTIGKNPNATLTTHTFPKANHILSLTQTGSVREVEGQLIRGGTKADGYYDTQLNWLSNNVQRAYGN